MNETPNYAELVAEIVTEEATVTVTRVDGKSSTGKLLAHPTDPALYKVVTGKRGRPFTFHPDDVEEITYE